MKRRKHSRTNRKDFPLAIDLRDFLMYSNPSRFAPKVRKTGGEAYPQAPTMDQFFSYGAPAPQVPFVFQDGGDTMSFSDPKPNRVGGFLDKIKRLGYEAIQKEMADEGMMMDDAYYQAANEMDLAAMQWGGGWTGGYETNFDAANQWLDKSQDTADVMGAYSNFVDAASNYGSAPDDYYIKKMKYKYKPTAQYGMELQEFQGNSGESQVNRDYAVSLAEQIKNLPYATGTKRVINRNEPIAMPDFYGGPNSFEGYIPTNTKIGMRFPATGNEPYTPFRPDWRPFQPEPSYPIYYPNREAATEGEKQVQENKQKQNQPVATTSKGKGKATPTNPAAPAAPPAAPETPAAGKQEEKPKDGTQPTAPETGAGAPENKTPQQVQQEAAQLGMSPQQYMTFLTHADVKMGPLGRRLRKASFDFTTYGPGMNPVTASANQQKPFFYDDATGKMEGAAPNGRRRDVPGENPRDRKDGFFKRLFGRPDEQERWNPEKGPKLEGRESLIGKSQFNPEGYSDKNYMSDIRNQRATDRLTRLGERIDRNIQRERSLDDFYDAGISNRMQRLRNRDERRYNRIANRFDREDYQDPRFRDYAYGGNMRYFQPGGGFRNIDFAQGDPADEEMPQFVTDMQGQVPLNQPKSANYVESLGRDLVDYSGSDKPLSETYVGDIAPVDLVQNQTQMMGEKGKGNLKVKYGNKKNKYLGEFVNAGLDLLSAGMTNREARQNEKMFRSKMGADQVFTPMQDMSRGDYTANEGYFRPDQQVPVQFSGYNFESPYARYGGSYQKGGEYYLSDEEIQEIINMGGEVEFLD